MNLLMKSGGFLLAGFALTAALELGETLSVPGVHSLIPDAQAVVGRPLTPVSVAGVARRTARRNN
ncbi:hypothetical protein [Pseudomonas alkylphenolica]|uniref:hypothetical protein n=1 Tax=Pseudomonas alkylphenolica TaxID=237609 RepID=UPI0018D98133|nr:hypothetical protein [Pseudomonas alkylphenolica]MBH3428137.1 hypothetical protein [Pseudomonas alkylphenolica]